MFSIPSHYVLADWRLRYFVGGCRETQRENEGLFCLILNHSDMGFGWSSFDRRSATVRQSLDGDRL